MAQTIKLKRSSVEGRVPTTSDLELGEIAINTYDGKAYIKKNDGTESIVEVGQFATFTPSGNDGELQYNDGGVSGAASFTFIDDVNNRLGLGTTSPQEPLSVESSGQRKILATNTDFASGTTGSSFDIGFGATSGNTYTDLRALINGRSGWGDLVLQRGGGNVGIGTASPSTLVEASKSQNTVTDIKVTNANAGAAAQSRFTLGNGGANFGAVGLLGSSFTTAGVYRQDGTYLYSNGAGGLTLVTGAAQPIYFAINNSEKMRIDSSGNVGIGTPSPTVPLHIVKAASGVNQATDVLRLSSVDTDTSYYVGFQTQRDNSAGMGLNILTTNVLGTVSEAMRITPSGNVGIGTTSPSVTLDVTGTINATAGFALTGNAAQVTTTYAGYTTSRFYTSTSGLNLAVDGAWPLIFSNNSTERMRITSAGNVGIGTNTPSTTLEVSGTVTATTFDGSLDWSNVANKPDPTLTLNGDVSGSATFTNLGNATLTVTVADDSHNHIISNVDGLQSALDAKLASSSYTAADVLTKIKTVDGSGSGLDADLLDGIQSSSFLRSDTGDSWSGDIETTGTNRIRFGNAYQLDDNDGTIAAARFGTGLNIVGAQTTTGTGRQVRVWGSLITDGGNAYWHSGNDGSGSGLDADLLDGFHLSSIPYATDGNSRGSVNTANSAAGSAANALTRSCFFRDNNVDFAALGINVQHSTSDNYNFQFGVQSYADASTLVARVKNNGTWGSSVSVWNSGNDGSGSGLDADLLDGLNSGSFLRADADNNITSYGFKTRFQSNTSGASTAGDQSGLEVFQSSASADAFMTFHVSGDFAGYFGLDGTTNDLFWGGWSRGAAKYRIWHAANDGSGSGLDADLVDGYHAAQTYYSTGNAAGSFLGGHYSSGGTEKPNSSTFGAGKFKIAMLSSSNLGFGGSWNDVLWTSAYNGGDVKKSFAFVSSKYDDTNVWVVKQNYDSASWGTGYLFWNAGNDGSGSGLDADLLDGLQASQFLRADTSNALGGDLTITNRAILSAATSNWTGDPGANGKIQYHSNRWYIVADSSSNRIVQFRRDGADKSYIDNNGTLVGGGMWSYYNDGSGSGLDADLLDGLNSGSFIRTDASTTFSTGYYITMVGNFKYTNDLYFYSTTNSLYGMKLSNSNGSITATGNITAYSSLSDIRLKENVEVISSSLNKVSKLSGVTFNYKKDKRRGTGLIAQQLQEVLPEAVYITESFDGDEEILAISYGNVVGLLVEAIKELKAEVDDLKDQLKEK